MERGWKNTCANHVASNSGTTFQDFYWQGGVQESPTKTLGRMHSSHMELLWYWGTKNGQSIYMAQSPKGRLVVQSLHRAIHGNCVFYFYPGVYLGHGWWSPVFFILTLTRGHDPNWLIFFRWVKTTNQMWFFQNSSFVNNCSVTSFCCPPPFKKNNFPTQEYGDTLLHPSGDS